MFIDEHAPFLSVFKSERLPHSQLHFTYTVLSEVVLKMKPLLTVEEEEKHAETQGSAKTIGK